MNVRSLFHWSFQLLAHFNIGQHLGTKSPYPTPPSSQPLVEYSLIHVQLLSRHGTRNPTPGNIQRFKRLEKYLKTQKQTQWSTWKHPFIDSHAGQLVEQGAKDMKALSRRAEQAYSLKNIQQMTVTSTKKHRTIDSAAAFLSVLHLNKTIHQYPRHKDYEHYFHANCPLYQKIQFFDGAKKYRDFLNEKVAPLLHDFSQRHGFLNLALNVFIPMYEMCAFEVSIWKRDDHFCSLFTKREFKILATAMDIRSYWRLGPGFEINKKMACRLWTSIFNDIKLAIGQFQRTLVPSAHLRFAHAETLIPFLSLLGLYSNDTFWQISFIAPFAANLWIEVYHTQKNIALENIRIRFLHNEIPVTLPVCATEYCRIWELENGYQDYLNCSFKKVCHL